ncbi:MAG: TetR family transcriptional regulator [Pseudomonadota bacterium]
MDRGSAAVIDSPQGKTEQTRAALIEAGIALFSRHGYEATSTRQIEMKAGVQRNLMTYHFGSKEAFWKAVMTQLFDAMRSTLEPSIVQSQDISPSERIRFVARRFVRASAVMPEIGRVMLDEGRSRSWRLDWLVEGYSRPLFEALERLVGDGRRDGPDTSIKPIQFYYLLVGSATMFTMSAECALLSGEDPLEDEMIDAQAETIASLLTSRPG